MEGKQKAKEEIIELLEESSGPMDLENIADMVDSDRDIAYIALRSLKKENKVNTRIGVKYMLNDGRAQ